MVKMGKEVEMAMISCEQRGRRGGDFHVGL